MNHKQLILEYLQAGNALTPLDAWRLWSILTSLRSRISDLRKDGHNIHTEMISENNKSFARYTLSTVVTERQGELF